MKKWCGILGGMSNEVVSPLDPAPFIPANQALTKVRLLATLPWCALIAIAAVVAAFLVEHWWPALGVAVAVGLAVWLGWLIPRQVRALGYRLDPGDLVIARGIMFRSVVSVPVGRLQYVEVTRGPIERMYGLSSLELHTASALTDATIHGLTEADAVALRGALVARGGAELMGL